MANEATCWECGLRGSTHQHHPVPRSRGGRRTLTLCVKCHAKAHHVDGHMATPALIRQGMAAAAAKGRHMGRAPFGWRIDADSGELRPDCVEQAVIRRIDALRADGLSWRAVAAALNAGGLRTRTGATWQNRSAQRVAERAAFKGGA